MTKSKKMLIAGAALAGLLTGTYASAQIGGGTAGDKTESGKKATKAHKAGKKGHKGGKKGQNMCRTKGEGTQPPHPEGTQPPPPKDKK